MLIHITSLVLSDAEETIIWRVEGPGSQTFNTNQIYHLIRERITLVTWSNICWFKRGVPKHQFLTWMFLYNRCPTKDIMVSWGIQVDPLCILCNSSLESKDDLFFECPYSRSALTSLVASFGFLRPFNFWDETILGLILFTGNNKRRYLLLLMWQALIYEIWRERNERIHR